MQKLVPFLLTSILFIAGVGYAQRTGQPLQSAVPNTALASTLCDESLWKHVYIGDRRRFDKPEDRLKIIDRCRTVTGTIVTSVPKPDGDSHVQILLDPQFKGMLNARNKSTHLGQHGFLVIEPICQQEPTQDDTVKGGSVPWLPADSPSNGSNQSQYQKAYRNQGCSNRRFRD